MSYGCSLTTKIPSLASVEMVEVLATRRALVFSKELRFDKVVVEGDSEIVITAILGDYIDYSYMGHVL